MNPIVQVRQEQRGGERVAASKNATEAKRSEESSRLNFRSLSELTGFNKDQANKHNYIFQRLFLVLFY